MKSKKIIVIPIVCISIIAFVIGAFVIFIKVDSNSYYYETYEDATEGNTSLGRTSWPSFLPRSISNIHHEERGEPAGTWLRFDISRRDASQMTSQLRRLDDTEISRMKIIMPHFVDWWFGDIKSRNSEDPDAIDADIFLLEGECTIFPELKNTFIAVDRNNEVGYLWCQKDLP